MLTDREKEKIDHEIAQFPQRSAACIEALKAVQEERGWISDENVKDIAAYLQMSPEQVDSVATFYNLVFRKPVGRHVILVCDSISCWVMGYDSLLEALMDKLGIGPGETTEDERFTLLPMCCLGSCDGAPVMMVDEDLHRELEGDKLDKILEQYE